MPCIFVGDIFFHLFRLNSKNTVGTERLSVPDIHILSENTPLSISGADFDFFFYLGIRRNFQRFAVFHCIDFTFVSDFYDTTDDTGRCHALE